MLTCMFAFQVLGNRPKRGDASCFIALFTVHFYGGGGRQSNQDRMHAPRSLIIAVITRYAPEIRAVIATVIHGQVFKA